MDHVFQIRVRPIEDQIDVREDRVRIWNRSASEAHNIRMHRMAEDMHLLQHLECMGSKIRQLVSPSISPRGCK